MAAFVSVSWTTGDVITETKLDNMVSNSQSEDAHEANGLQLANNVPYQAKQAGGTVKDLIKLNTSDQTLIGSNGVRATRFVPINPGVEVVNTDPANSNWTTVDITANTSATAFAVSGNSIFTISSGTGQAFVVATGDTQTADGTTRIARTQVVGAAAHTSFIIPLDTSQSFDWSVNSANVTSFIMTINGYFEYVD